MNFIISTKHVLNLHMIFMVNSQRFCRDMNYGEIFMLHQYVTRRLISRDPNAAFLNSKNPHQKVLQIVGFFPVRFFFVLLFLPVLVNLSFEVFVPASSPLDVLHNPIAKLLDPDVVYRVVDATTFSKRASSSTDHSRHNEPTC